MERTDAAGSQGALSESPRITAALVDFRLDAGDDIEIRPLHVEDADTVYELTVANRDHLAPWMTWIDKVIDVSDTHAFLRAAERQAHEHTSFTAGIWCACLLVGAIDIHEIDWANAHGNIGYWLAKDHVGQGIMTRAVRALTEYAFEALGLHRVEIRVATENHASRRIPERLGFTLEGVLREVQRIRDRYVDLAVYALVREP